MDKTKTLRLQLAKESALSLHNSCRWKFCPRLFCLGLLNSIQFDYIQKSSLSRNVKFRFEYRAEVYFGVDSSRSKPLKFPFLCVSFSRRFKNTKSKAFLKKSSCSVRRRKIPLFSRRGWEDKNRRLRLIYEERCIFYITFKSVMWWSRWRVGQVSRSSCFKTYQR